MAMVVSRLGRDSRVGWVRPSCVWERGGCLVRVGEVAWSREWLLSPFGPLVDSFKSC